MKPLSLYIHVPFCSRRCPYCTFYHTNRSHRRERTFVERAANEITTELTRLGAAPVAVTGHAPERYLHTIYIGGGTPSALSPESLDTLFELLDRFLIPERLQEWTVELNPEDVTVDLIGRLRRTGAGRISLGVQSMNDRLQHTLQRCTVAVNRAAIESVRPGFNNINLDLLLGVPGSSTRDVIDTAEELLRYEPRHFSVYCLESGGDVSEDVEAFLKRVDQEEAASQYLALCERLGAAGYHHYEVSNFALPGFESKHNLAYWRGGEYLGIGPAAHSCIDGERRYNRASIDDYCSGAPGDFSALRIIDTPNERERRLERLLLGLRTSRGVPLDAVTERQAVVDALLSNRLARIAEERIVLTDRGYLLLDEIVLRLAESENGPDPGARHRSF